MKRTLALLGLFLTASAFAEAGTDPFTGGSVEAGAGKAAVCAACHGQGGGNPPNPDWPKLAGQHAAYTLAQLQILKAGLRPSPVMNAQAASLSEQDMKDLAAYFAAQPATPGVGSPDSLKVADPLYRFGDTSRDLPACGACHGPAGAGNAGAQYPRISGQNAVYTARVLRELRALNGATIPHPPMVTMAAVAAKLTDAEIDALASYLNGLN